MLDQLAALKAGRNWRQVAAIIARCSGVSKSDVWWLRLARGDKRPGREDENAVRSCFPGWPMLPPSADELADVLGVETAYIADDDPDAALFVRLDGKHISQVVMKASADESPVIATRLATSGSISVVNRKRHEGQSINYMDDLAKLPPSAFATNKGKTGNLAAIQAAAKRAAEGCTG